MRGVSLSPTSIAYERAVMIPPCKQTGELAAAFVSSDQMKGSQPQMRDDVVRLVDAARGAGIESWVIVNNKAEGSSPLTVLALASAAREADRVGGCRHASSETCEHWPP